jgi:hypothetical protein
VTNFVLKTKDLIDCLTMLNAFYYSLGHRPRCFVEAFSGYRLVELRLRILCVAVGTLHIGLKSYLTGLRG